MILSLRALPWVRESRPLTGKFQGMQLGSLAVGDNVTDSRPRGNSLSRVELVLSARLLRLACTPLSMVAWVFRFP